MKLLGTWPPIVLTWIFPTMSQQWLLPRWEWNNRGCWRRGTQMWKCFHSNAGNTGNTGSAQLKRKKKKGGGTKHGRCIKMIYGGKEHLIGSLQLILIFSTPISSNFWGAEAGSLGVLRVKGAVLSVCVLVTQSCPTLCDPMDWSPSGFSVHGILQAGILEWVAISFPQGIFPTQGSNPHLLCLLHWQACSLPLVPPGRCYLGIRSKGLWNSDHS